MSTNWLASSIIYQIFPDRFHIGNNLTVHDKIRRGLYAAGAIPKNWDDLPQVCHEQSSHFFGGDLAGIIEKLDYVQQLGANAIYLTPIFRSPSYHKYDTLDYRQIDPALGDFETFERLIQQAHARNIKIIIDIVLNHLSNHHPYFQDAINNPASKYREFFSFTDYPHTYNCWWGYKNMPELRLEHPAVQDEFITGPNSVIRFWLERGVDGIRLDCANDLGIEPCRLIYETAKSINPDAVIIGELAGFAADWLNRLDGVQSYFPTVSIYSLLDGQISAAQFGANLSALYAAAPQRRHYHSFTMLSSHDYLRALTLLKGDMRKYAAALILQFTLPGAPMIYYGEEIGMEGERDPMNRAPMRWNPADWKQDVLSLYRRLIQTRRERAELQCGEFMELSQWLNNGVVAYLRYLPDDLKQFALIVVNPTNERKRFRLFVPYSYFLSDVIMIDIFSGQKTQNIDGYLDIEIEAMTGTLSLPDYLHKPNYSFYKRI